jgi:hypothetical protein
MDTGQIFRCRCLGIVVFILMATIQNVSAQKKPDKTKVSARDELDELLYAKDSLTALCKDLSDSVVKYDETFKEFGGLQTRKDEIYRMQKEIPSARNRLIREMESHAEVKSGYERLDGEVKQLDLEIKTKREDSLRLSKRADTIRRVSILSRRDESKANSTATRIEEINSTMSDVSEAKVLGKFKTKTSVVLEQMAAFQNQLVTRENIYDETYARSGMEYAEIVKGIFPDDELIQSLCSTMMKLSIHLTALSDSKRLLASEYQKGKVDAMLGVLKDNPKLHVIDTGPLYEETAKMRDLLSGYCETNARYWLEYNKSVNPIPTVSLGLLRLYEPKLDRGYAYLYANLQQAMRMSESGRLLIEKKPLPSCK